MILTECEIGLIKLRSKLDQIYSIEPKDLKFNLEVKILDIPKQIAYPATILYVSPDILTSIEYNNFYSLQLQKFYNVKNPIKYVRNSVIGTGITVGTTDLQLVSTVLSGIKLQVPKSDAKFVQVLYLPMSEYFKEWLVFNKNWKL